MNERGPKQIIAVVVLTRWIVECGDKPTDHLELFCSKDSSGQPRPRPHWDEGASRPIQNRVPKKSSVLQLSWRRESSDWLHLTNPPALRRDQQGATVGQMSCRSGSRKLSAAWPAHYKTLIFGTHTDRRHRHYHQWKMASSTLVVQREFSSKSVWRDNGV